MKFASIPMPDAAAVVLLLLVSVSPVASMLHCNQIIADGKKFDLSKLGGPHSVVVSELVAGNYHNTTFTTDICRQLKRKGTVPEGETCRNGARVCAITRLIGKGDDHEVIEKIEIAGELADYGGGHLDAVAHNLGSSDSIGDSGKEGVRITMNGGFREAYGQKRPQKAVIEFLCDKDREGTEGEWDPEDDKYEEGDDPLRIRSFGAMEDGEKDGGEGDGKPKLVQLGPANASLVFESYGAVDESSNTDVLKLTWKSKYACLDQADKDDGQASSHWGFFTWIVIIVFLGTAAYLIFGSWLNYNRYGARGWDLLPHGDTIRDVPYLMKDWTRRVLNTVQGSGSRGGYSAV
ncbi:autophagy-related protein 27 [Pseudomassariella vexata]|uniref:Autophagy-related protein 27 n=1 Tax=Pseudomassariella vexata TaxID=1141098 RepID=A0A1Y2DLG7_9PEZI|nr:autophagy-related protein 27 [Pseudomassariella vexata]ORY59956.1 autophagy-related protein 27 [Pseudomassariella vexata]